MVHTELRGSQKLVDDLANHERVEQNLETPPETQWREGTSENLLSPSILETAQHLEAKVVKKRCETKTSTGEVAQLRPEPRVQTNLSVPKVGGDAMHDILLGRPRSKSDVVTAQDK